MNSVGSRTVNSMRLREHADVIQAVMMKYANGRCLRDMIFNLIEGLNTIERSRIQDITIEIGAMFCLLDLIKDCLGEMSCELSTDDFSIVLEHVTELNVLVSSRLSALWRYM